MSFKIGSKLVIFDSAYNGPDTGGMFGQYDSNLSRLEPVSSAVTGGGHNLYFNNTSQVVEITPPEIDYGTGRSSIILNLKNTDTDDNAIQHMFLKINGNRQTKGYKKLTGTDIGYITPSGFSSSNRGASQALDISSNGLNWYFGHDQDNYIYHFDNTVPWGVSTIGFVNGFDHSSFFENNDSPGRVYKALRISETGEKLYIMTGDFSGNLRSQIHQFTLDTPFSLSTVTHDSSFDFKIPMAGDTSILAFVNDIDSTNNNITQLWDFDRDGKRVLVTNNEGDRTAVLKLKTPWDLSKVKTETLGKFYGFPNSGSGSTIRECRLDKDGKTARMYRSSSVGSSYGGLRSFDWKTPWQIWGSFDSTFEERPSEQANSGARIYRTWHMRPGGHHFIGFLNYTLGDRLYKINTQDSSNATEIAELVFPPNVHFENGYQPDFPDSGEALWLEMLSFDSGNNWYAKKIYGG